MTMRFEVFPSDLDETEDFYTRVLRFTLVRRDDGEAGPYLSLRRDHVHVGAAWRPEPESTQDRRPPVGVELVLEVDDLDAELAHVTAAGWPLEEPMQDRPWGLRDFRVLDPSGYYLRITSRS